MATGPSTSDEGPSVALVLGAGGVAGGAWHAGVLAALDAAGWDPRTADLVVGTSAGSGMAATLRLGMPPRDLVALPLGEEVSEHGASLAARAGAPMEIPRPTFGGRIPTPQAPSLLGRLASPSRVAAEGLRPFKTVTALLPRGRASTTFIGDRIRRTHDRDWPERPTWICAMRLSDGELVVFGRDVTDAHLATAVEASSSIPGYFAPVEHGGETYVDGGVHSPTNADVVAGLGHDLVIVSSPMSATSAALRRPRFSGARGMHATLLGREVQQVRDAGSPVLVLQPGPEVVDVIGGQSMDLSRRAAIVEASYRTVATHLASDAVADRLAILGIG